MEDFQLTEFISLSRCLPALLGPADESDCSDHKARGELANNIMRRMQQLLPKPKQKPIPDDSDSYLPKELVGDRVLTDEVEGERQLLADKILRVVVDKIGDVGPDDAPGTMIELCRDDVNEEWLVQAYSIPDPSSNSALQIFRYRILLASVD